MPGLGLNLITGMQSVYCVYTKEYMIFFGNTNYRDSDNILKV